MSLYFAFEFRSYLVLFYPPTPSPGNEVAISLGFALQSFTIGCFKLPLFRTISRFPPTVRNSGLQLYGLYGPQSTAHVQIYGTAHDLKSH